ncbi:MAG: extracellular solute-binding protein [Phycisphaeraceae bacterium]|nr:extracellular solute-binding protein [Phycisphaeraceae bacterium]
MTDTPWHPAPPPQPSGRSRWPGTVLALLFAVVLGLPVVLSFIGVGEEAVSPSGLVLIIVTPNNEQIRYEQARGFNRYRKSQGLPQVTIDWRSWGGTSDLRKGVLSSFEAQVRAAIAQGRDPIAATGESQGGSGYDLFLGGGDFEHEQLARGLSIRLTDKSLTIPIAQAPTLPPGLLEEVFPTATIGSERLYHPQKLWIGTALSSFGIVYNRDVLARLRIPQPTTWQDLADPRLAGWVVLADPAHSGSIATTYDVILRRLGWPTGWAVLRRSFANARSFTASASGVPTEVSAGQAAAGMCIDFYGRYQAGAIHGQRVGYVDPPFMTAITADPVTLLRGAPHSELASEFIAWLLSQPGQTLWQRRLDADSSSPSSAPPATPPAGSQAQVRGLSPQRYELRRLPARRDVYSPAEMALWTDPVNPFDIARPFPPGMPSFFSLVSPITKAMAVDVHADLQAAWAALNANPDHPRRAQMLALFDAMPPELTIAWPDPWLAEHWPQTLAEADHPRQKETIAAFTALVDTLRARWKKDPNLQLEDQLAWTRFFQDHYRRVVRLADESP